MNQLHRETLKFVVRQLIKDIKEYKQDVKGAYTPEDVNYYQAKVNCLIEQKIKFEGMIKHAALTPTINLR